VACGLIGAGAFLLSAPLAADEQSSVYESNILPTASLYGGIGLLDMRNARFMPDGYLALNIDVKQPDNRFALTFQALPWMETTFRYAVNYALAPIGQRALYDRSFDVKIRLFNEGEYTPQVAFGLQDFIGTGVYSAEYLVASKRFGPVDVTAGMGWGRLASRGTFVNPFCEIVTSFCTRNGDLTNTGGTPLFSNYFHGPQVGIFGGIEYETPIPDLTAKLEYSTDDYVAESSYRHNPAIVPKNYAPVPVNGGLSYRFWSNVDLGVALIGGRELSVNLNLSMNPAEPNWPVRLDPPPPFVARPAGDGRSITQLGVNNDGTGNAWPVQFIDLTGLAKPDARPPDPSLFHEGEWNIAATFQEAGIHLTDAWLAGHTLVAQVDSASIPEDACRRLGKNGSLPAPRVVLLAADWSPIETCTATPPTKAVEKPGAAPQPQMAWTPNILAIMRQAIESQKLVVQGIAIAHGVVKVEIENDRYFRDAEAISRTVRALSASAPADIGAFQVTTSIAHVPLTTVTIPRSQIDAEARGETTPAELWASTILSDAPPGTDYGHGASDPQFTWSIFPSIQEDVFDPNNPVYFGVGVSGSTRTELLPGLVLDDEATYDVYNNFGSITRPSNSLLPHVRTDIVDYLQKGSTGINDLTLSYYVKPTAELYARFTAGYIEQMFGGVGGEVLYRPMGQRWALGADLYDVYQRNFDDLFGFQNYHVVTGHASLYVETPWEDITTVVRAGRYLAGDYGATLELYKRFDTGIIVGAWATFTNVPFSVFGEGSFDKGIRIVIPTEWALPFGSPTKYELDLRPIQRDGGQPLNNDAELYDMTQSSSYGDLERQWPHVFQ